jgi:hypothetical protein
MKKKEERALRTMLIAGMLGALVPIGKMWSVGTLPAMWTAACFSGVVIAGIYFAVIAEDK